MSTEFYDAADYRNIAPRSAACVYGDGLYVCSAADAYARFSRVRFITVLGGEDAAKYAGAADFEPGNEVFDLDRLEAWVKGRRDMKCLARVYCDLENLQVAHSAVKEYDNVRWWIASWGEKRTAAELAAATGGLIKADTVWAQQYAGNTTGGYDTSVLLGTW